MRLIGKIIFSTFIFSAGCYNYSGWERYSDLPEHYTIAVKLLRAYYNPALKDTVFKPVYGKTLETDTAVVISNKVPVLADGSYKVQIECKWQNPNPGLRVIFEIGNWNGFVKFQAHEEDEAVFEQTLILRDSTYKLIFGVTDGFTPETEKPFSP